VTETVDGEWAGRPSVAVDAFGNRHVSCCDVRPTAPNGAGAGLRHAYRANGEWLTESVRAAACADPSLALESAGEPRIAYDEPPHHDLVYVHWAAPLAVEAFTTVGGSLTSSEDHTSYLFPTGAFTD
jgi:hypothetical protein